jgi:ribosomal protein L19
MTLSELKSSKVFELRKIAKGLGVERKRDGNYKTVETLRSEKKGKLLLLEIYYMPIGSLV